MKAGPTVSVVMAVFNGEKYLCEAIDSILEQTFEGFEFVIIDDGSTDATPAILRHYKEVDHRVHIHVNAHNLGLTQSLNLGLRWARGRFIARMDADDISYPQRLARQLDFMSRHPDVDVVGSWVQILCDGDSSDIWMPPSEHSDIIARLCFYSVLYHPSVFIRRESSKGLPIAYDPCRRAAQDYDLWVRLAMDYGAKFANVPEVLLTRRLHGDAIGSRVGELQQAVAADVRRLQLEKLGIHPSAEEFELHNAVSTWRFGQDRQFLRYCANWLIRLRRANDAVGLYPKLAFYDTLDTFWFAACRRAATGEGLSVWLYYLRRRVTPVRRQRLNWLLQWIAGKVAVRRAD